MRNLGVFARVGVIVAVVAGSGVGSAWAAKGRVGVRFSGSDAGPARDAIVQVLEKHDLSVVPAERLEATATKMHRGLDSTEDLAAVAAKLKLVGVVAGEVKDGGRKAGAVVRSGSSGKVTAKALWSVAGGKKLADAVKATAWARLGPGLHGGGAGGGGGEGKSDAAYEKLVAAAERDSGDDDDDDKGAARKPAPEARRASADEAPAEKPEPTKRSQKSDADLEAEAGIAPNAETRPSERASERQSERPSARHSARAAEGDESVVVARPGRPKADSQGGLTALELGVGPRLLWRDLHYSGTTGAALIPFSMSGSPTLGASAVWFPGAHVTTGPAANIGVAGNVEYASGINSKATDGASFPTATTDFFGGLRVRLPDGPIQLNLTGGYGRHAFVFHSGTNTDRANINVPDVDNRYLRGAGDVRVAFSPDISLDLGAGYRRVIAAGDARYQLRSTQYFPNATVWGMDATASLGVRFLSVMEARVGYDLRRYAYTTNAAAGAALSLPSFVDKYSAFWLNIALVVDGPPAHSKKRARHGDDDDEG